MINIGPPASGKSTFTEDFIKNNDSWVRVSRDSFRYMLKNTGWCHYKLEK